MKSKLLKALCLMLSVITLLPIAVSAENTNKEEGILKIAVFSGLDGKNSAPYNSASIAGLFNSKGHSATVINSDILSCKDEFNNDNYDLLIIPTGSAFPYDGIANLKSFFASGGKIITSGGYAFSEIITAADSAVFSTPGVNISSEKETTVCLSKSLPASDFEVGKEYTASVYFKHENISTLNGLAHLSVYIYDSSNKLLLWKDYGAITSGTNDWSQASYTFRIPEGTARVEIKAGFYLASGSMTIDNYTVTSSSGEIVYSENFDNGFEDWQITGNAKCFTSCDGMESAGNTCISVHCGTAQNSCGRKYDISDYIKKGDKALFEMIISYTSLNGVAGAYVVFEKDGKEVNRYTLSEEASSIDRHRRKQEIEIPEFDKAYISFEFNDSIGRINADDIKISVDGNTVYENLNCEKEGTDFGNISYTPISVKYENTHIGTNDPLTVGDAIMFATDTIQVFDEETVYDDVVEIKAAEGQSVFPEGTYLTDKSGISGYSAITTVSNNRARWQVLLWGYDAFGRKAGAIASIARSFSSYTDDGLNGYANAWGDYKNAGIGFFGVTNKDLFAEENTMLREGLVNLAETLCNDAYIGNVENLYDCYKKGESPVFTVKLENQSKQSQKVSLKLTVKTENGDTVFEKEENSSVVKGLRKNLRIEWENPEFTDDFYYVTADLYRDGEKIDSYETGFVVWDDEVVKNGVNYTYHDNYIYIKQSDGTEKAVFATGVDDGANLFINDEQTPLKWKNEFEARKDAGLYIYENLQQYRVFGDFDHLFTTANTFEKHMRTVDCAVYLAQKYNQIYMMGILIGSNTAADDEALADDKAFAVTMAERYKDVPGIIYYLNGDLVVKPGDSTDTLFREYLKERYQTDEAFQKAWNSKKTLDTITYDTSYKFDGNGWSDVKAYDQNVFRTWMIKRWTSSISEGIIEKCGDTKAILCEFYAWPCDSVDVPMSIGSLTYSNIGYFMQTEGFAETLAYSDQRYCGKSSGVGEANKRTHPLISGSTEYYSGKNLSDTRTFFYTTCLTTLAMGGNHYQVWCWSDETKYTFPWGMNYADGTERDNVSWMRSVNLATGGIEPVYAAPSVAFITADSTRMSGSEGSYLGHFAVTDAINIAQGTHCDNILTLNECNLIIPDEIKVIYYPLAYTMPDDVYEKLKAFVEKGGVLYISGDFAYDELSRERSHEDRLEYLAGVKCENVNIKGLGSGKTVKYTSCGVVNDSFERSGVVNIDISLTSAVALYSDSNGKPIITENKVGNGVVIYSSAPFEYNASDASYTSDVAIYRYVLNKADISVIPVSTSRDSVKVFTQSLTDGKIVEFFNASSLATKLEFTLPSGTYNTRLSDSEIVYAIQNSEEKITAFFGSGITTKNGEKFISSECGGFTIALDNKDITQSTSLAITPVKSGAYSVSNSMSDSNAKAIYGIISNGEFVKGGEIQLTFNKGTISFEAKDDIVGSIVIISENTDSSIANVLSALRLQSASPTPEEESSDTEESSEAKAEEKGGNAIIYIAAGIAIAAIATAALIIFKKKKSK